jgi:predicted nucleic acid-binding protein
MNPAFVVDSSVAMAWCFLDQAMPSTKKLLERMGDETALVPGLWFIELTNVLFLAEKKARIDGNKVSEFITLVQSFNLEVDQEASGRAFSDVLPLCRTHQLTSYDAIYLDLAVRRKLPLATLDEPLRRAAKKVGVKLHGR